MNVSNGGLIASLCGDLYVCDLSGYGGTRVISRDGSTDRDIGVIMWFAAPDGNGLYCSNQKDYDYLTYINGNDGVETCLQKRPCANLALRGGNVLFIDEEDSLVYEYDPGKDKSSLVIKETTTSFILVSDTLYFAAEGGLKCLDLSSGCTEKLADCFPVCLNFTNGYLVFADEYQDFALCRYDVSQGKFTATDDIRAQSIITTEEYIFASNLADNNSVVRADLVTGESIRFCGDSADKLHIVDKYLYFLNQNDNNAWYKVPLAGGRPARVCNS